MMNTIHNLYCESLQKTCAEKGCKATTGKGSNIYCAEILDKILNHQTQKMCDCIITNSTEDKISIVELKFREGKSGVMKGRGLAGRIEDVRTQLVNGLKILFEILEKVQKKNVKVQLVLYTKKIIKDRSELKQLQKPPDNRFTKLTIQNVSCGDILPNKYVPIWPIH